jgi:hypothetical protein
MTQALGFVNHLEAINFHLHCACSTCSDCVTCFFYLQALSERRLKLVLDSSGRCTHVLSGDESVFGFSPDDLVGASLGDFIDAFQVCPVCTSWDD